MMELEKFKVVCKKCGKEPIVEIDSSGCNDPDCCGGRSYSLEIQCDCGEEEEQPIY